MSVITTDQLKVINLIIDETNNAWAEEGAYLFWTLTYVQEFSFPERSRIILCYFELDDKTNQVNDQQFFVITDVDKFLKKHEELMKQQELEYPNVVGIGPEEVGEWIK